MNRVLVHDCCISIPEGADQQLAGDQREEWQSLTRQKTRL
jgi:hypothetical protein